MREYLRAAGEAQEVVLFETSGRMVRVSALGSMGTSHG